MNTETFRPRTSGGSKNVAGISALIMVAIVGAMLVVFSGGPPFTKMPSPQVTSTQAAVKLEGTALIVDFEAEASDGPFVIQTYLIGEPLPPDAVDRSFKLLGRGLEVIHPTASQSGAPMLESTNQFRRWRSAFVLPSEVLAKRALENLQPIGPLEVVPGRWYAGELFQVIKPDGSKYTAYLAIGSADDGRSPFPIGAHIGGKDHSVMLRHDNVELHYAIYHAGSFSTSSSGSQNPATGNWSDEGSISFPGKRSFSYRRIDRYPDELNLNGRSYDLRKGRILILNDDGTVEQLAAEFPLGLARNPVVLGEWIAREQSR